VAVALSCVALRAVPYVIAAGVDQAIVGVALLTVNVLLLSVAEVRFASPANEYWIVYGVVEAGIELVLNVPLKFPVVVWMETESGVLLIVTVTVSGLLASTVFAAFATCPETVMLVCPYRIDEDAASELKTAVALPCTVNVAEVVMGFAPPSQAALGVPMTVKELVPGCTTPFVVDIVSTEVGEEPPDPTTDDGLNVAVAPLGNEEVLKMTVQAVEFPVKLTVTP
jgi:hypothetical protein